MKRTHQLKHLGLIINTLGDVTHDQNIEPVKHNMDAIADSYNTSQSTPLGRAIYAKYLLASKYIHRIQNTVINPTQFFELQSTILNMTGTRSHPAENTIAYRVHIAQDRVAQPPRYGGLSVPDPQIQIKSIRFIWVRKFLNAERVFT